MVSAQTYPSLNRIPGPLAVIGASGLLGREILRDLKLAGAEVMGTALRRAGDGCTLLDIQDAVAVEQFLDAFRPAVVVIAAGEKRADVCEHDPVRARALNLTAPAFIARRVAAYGGRTLYISTDYVFDGNAAPYFPHSVPEPINAYGLSKREGELAVLNAGSGSAVLRLPLLFGPTGDLSESAVTSVLLPGDAGGVNRGANRIPIPVDNWAIRYPTLTADVASVCRQIIEQWLEGTDLSGIHHWSGSDAYTKYALSCELAALAQLPETAFIPSMPGPADVPRPYNCHLDTSSLTRLGIRAATPLRQALADVVQPHLRQLAALWA
jgi:dTDP-4-dehydrorhamnose reductase